MKLEINMDISPVHNEQIGLSNENTLRYLRGRSEYLHNAKCCHSVILKKSNYILGVGAELKRASTLKFYCLLSDKYSYIFRIYLTLLHIFALHVSHHQVRHWYKKTVKGKRPLLTNNPLFLRTVALPDDG
jgi:hypothetical protein